MSASSHQSEWSLLFRTARSLIDQVNSERSIIDHWTFGGGTALMLQIDHRASRDVDIFLSDPQVLPFLDPQKQDFQFEIQPADYGGDGVRSLKLVFDQIGEIDFIVAASLTSSPTTRFTIEREPVLLETLPEIIAKKIFYRGASIKPRDLFDIAAAAESHADSLVTELRNYRDQVVQTLSTIGKLNVDFVNRSIAELVIAAPFRFVAGTALERAKELLRAV